MSTVYLRYVDKQGHVSVMSHQCWDAERFLIERKKDWEKEDGTATQVNQDVYRRHNWNKHG